MKVAGYLRSNLPSVLPPAEKTLYIFLDESGDLGWNPGSSKHLVIGTVCTRQRRRVRKLMRRFKEQFNVPLNQELKASDAGPKARRWLMARLAADMLLYCRAIVVYKPNVKSALQERSNLLYNFAAGLLLVPHIENLARVHLSVDPREQKVKAPYAFDRYLEMKLYAEGDSSVELLIQRPESNISNGIQAADYLCNTVFRHFEGGEETCFGMIQPRLELHRLFFP